MLSGNKQKYSQVCIVDTVYSLFIYLLLYDEEKIKNTFFFFSDGIDVFIRKKFIHSYFISEKEFHQKSRCKRLYFRIKLKIIAYYKWPFLKSAKLYGHDHIFFTPCLIGNRKMTVIEDGIANYREDILLIPHRKFSYFRKLLFGCLSIKSLYGSSDSVDKVILTGLSNIPDALKEKSEIIDIYNLWNSLSERLQNVILYYFSLDKSELQKLSHKNAIIFTQPLNEFMEDQEIFEIYQKMISEVDKHEVIIKRHPRDHFDYKKYFSNVEVFDKPIPMELLTLLGLRFKEAYTICSSAVLTLPYTINIHFLGTSIHPKLMKEYGEININDFLKH